MKLLGKSEVTEKWMIPIHKKLRMNLIDSINLRPYDEITFLLDDNKNLSLRVRKASEVEEEDKKRWKK